MEKWLESIYSDGSKFFVSNPLPKRGEKIKIFIRMYDSSPVKAVMLRTKLNGIENVLNMDKEFVENGLAYYSTEVTVYEDVLHYHFYLVTEDKIYFYNQKEIVDYMPAETYDFKILIDYNQPSWVKKSVFYQIFPERFCNGNTENDVKTGEYYFDGYPAVKIEDWNAEPKEYNESHCLDFYGGDLEGVKEKIPYLKKLGVNAIYMNPIFYAATVHKYDCLDYFNVDPHFGGNKAFAELMDELHKNNMKLMLDVSINHTGTANRWFNKEGIFFDKSEGAYNNKNSKERKYYFFDDDNKYKSWFNVDTLPTLNYTSEELKEIIYKGEKSLVKKWLKPPYNIDGWRFDVADTMARNNEIQLHHEVWPEIRKRIKEENPDAYIIGEDWCDHNEFLNGDEWDSAMNYFGFGRPVRSFLGETDFFMRENPNLSNISCKITAKNFANRIKEHLCRLPFVIQENQFNLFDSHDISRLHNNEKISFEEYRGAVIMLFTMIGTANMYYGDEAGIDGRLNTNEGCRYPMPWNKDIESRKYYKLYSKLAHLKTSEESLQDGGFKILSDEDYVFSYARFTRNDLFIIIFSTDDMDRRLKIPVKIFGKDSKSTLNEVFGTKLNFIVEGEEINLEIKAHTSYLIKL